MPVPIDELRSLMAVALAGLLLLLRLDAPRFASAEYDSGDGADSVGWRLTRLAWPVLAILLAAGIAILMPAGPAAIGLGAAQASSAASIVLAILGAAVGAGAVVGLAWLLGPSWPPRLPGTSDAVRYAFDAVATAVVDEVTFRGVLLGLLLLVGVPPAVAFLGQLLVYGLETRLGRSSATLGLLAETLALGVLTGLLALATGSIAAPLVAHAVTRFAALDLGDGSPPLLSRRQF